MSILPNNTTSPNATTTLQMKDNTSIEEVSQLKYLENTLSSHNSLDAEIEPRTNGVSQVFRSISRLVWYQAKIKAQTKLKLQIGHPSNLFVWQQNLKPFNTSYTKTSSIRKSMLENHHWHPLSQKKKNPQHKKNAKINRVDVNFHKQILQWLGHMERMADERLPI